MSPYRPTRTFCSSPSFTAVVTKTRSPHTTGQENPSPGSGVFHLTFLPAGTSHMVGAATVDTPEANAPRNCGQLLSSVPAEAGTPAMSVMRRIAYSACERAAD